ncbi:hypothetical protein [Paenibacillus massiliensis]|uniref:hypothetical protein n=1 Tax=Paenibacillus massiliensis TaxID=225917 RepID=UPI00046F8933|nr:hypothetical protein [Paenibacillus massiliensis]
MSENTPKLDLLMKDPVLDGHEYFNVKTMMNDNWEKIDAFADTVDGEVKELQQRLDTEQRKEITLQPGLQIIESDKTVPFRLTGLKGRTLVNLLGRDGNCENINRFTPTRAVLTADTTIKTQGTQSLKITSTGLPTGAATGQSFSVKAGSYYILVGDVRLGSGTYAGPHVAGISNTKNNGNATDTTNFSTVWRAYSALSNAATVSLVSEVAGPVESVAYFDALRFYEITAEEYAALDNMSAEQVGAKYPYVDSVKPVRNPYVIRYGENLLPSFYEWGYTSASAGKVIAPNILSIDSTIVGPNLNAWVPVRVIRNTEYTLSVSHNGMIGVYDENQTTPLVGYSSAQEVTFNSGSREIIHVFFRVVAINTGSYLFTNPMLNIGKKSLPYTPHENSMLALQTDLYADSLTGATADFVFERDGQYYKNKQWNSVVINDSLAYSFNTHTSSVKRVIASGLPSYNPSTAESWSPLMTKFNGVIIPRGDGSVKADTMNGDAVTPSIVYINVSNTDSGWGENYTNPTPDEIKAYFLGWKMYDYQNSQGGTSIYNGQTGQTKAWCRLSSWNGSIYLDGGYTTLPTTQAVGHTPYELIYKLATPTVEPLVSEGQLTLSQGSNQVEIGAGIVLRELTTPYVDSVGWMNLGNPVASPVSKGFKNVAGNILGIYRNGRVDTNWSVARTQAYGALAQMSFLKLGSDFDSSAAYTVTYLMRDLMPVAEFVGSVPDNEKSLLADIVQDVQKTSSRLSVVESKKAEKDSPSWISPTLLNGWINYGSVDSPAGYYRDSLGVVHLQGLVKNGTSVVFRLPYGYRPAGQLNFASIGSVGASESIARVSIRSNGDVLLTFGAASTFLSLSGISFLVEK